MWIKICGITTLQDAQMAVASGADAVGFVFAESPRNVNPEAVREISSRLPNSIEKIGIFVDATADEMADTIRVAGLTGVQWHGDLRKGLSYDLRERVRETRGQLRILQVLHHDEDLQRFEIQLRELQMNMELDAVLVDTRVAGKRGGTGVPFNWQAARDSFLQHVPHIRLIAAGGLRPENVRQAIHTLRPWGVDVSSGVETAPGCKDLQRVRSFVQVARAADMELWNAEVLAQATHEYARQQD